MLGTIRFLLSFCVVAFHLTQYIPHIGILAVNFFYAISGYLITLVLQESYGFKFIPFAKNRFLRLFPSYFLLAAISLLLAKTTKSHSLFHPSWSGQSGFGDALGNIFIIPWAFLSDPLVHVNSFGLAFLDSEEIRFRLIPSTWSVGVEMACYLILWVFSARSFLTAIISLLAACFWHFYVANSDMNPLMNYFPVFAAMLPFSLGTIAYHTARKYEIKPLKGEITAIVVTSLIILAFTLNWHASKEADLLPSIPYYANIAISFFAILIINKTRLSGRIGHIDKWLGDLAYPMFLGHYVFGFFAWHILDSSATPSRGTDVFLLGSALTIAASTIIILLIDKRIIEKRNSIRLYASN